MDFALAKEEIIISSDQDFCSSDTFESDISIELIRELQDTLEENVKVSEHRKKESMI